MNEREVFAQIKLRERGQDAAEDQKGEEGDQGHRKKLIGKKVAKTLHPLEIDQDTVKDNKSPTPESEPNDAHQEESQAPASYIF
jgi:hypothetical protein